MVRRPLSSYLNFCMHQRMLHSSLHRDPRRMTLSLPQKALVRDRGTYGTLAAVPGRRETQKRPKYGAPIPFGYCSVRTGMHCAPAEHLLDHRPGEPGAASAQRIASKRVSKLKNKKIPKRPYWCRFACMSMTTRMQIRMDGYLNSLCSFAVSV
jgi:hypothetical protein